jgi:site-specific recombinase XerD
MNDNEAGFNTERKSARRDTRKKDNAPRGVFRHPSGAWAIRYACGAGCAKHEERIGPLKSDAIRAYHDRRARAHSEPGWCPAVARRRSREKARAERAAQRARVTFEEYGKDYIAWARTEHRAWAKEDSRLTARLLPAFGPRKLDEITTADVERFLDGLRRGDRAVSPASRNRYRDQLSGMFKRSLRLGLVTTNPVKGIPKVKEPSGRIAYLSSEEEDAVRAALPPALRPVFTVSINTGLRWSEQAGLVWRDVDVLTGIITVRLSKNGTTRRVPMNSVTRATLYDLAAARVRPTDPSEPVFTAAYRTTARALEIAVEAAQATLAGAGKDTSRLDGFTWHGNRHTFASRLVTAGVDLRAVQELGGWKTLSMVQRYAHLAPERLAAAVERIVSRAPSPAPSAAPAPASELRRNFGDAALHPSEPRAGVS